MWNIVTGKSSVWGSLKYLKKKSTTLYCAHFTCVFYTHYFSACNSCSHWLIINLLVHGNMMCLRAVPFYIFRVEPCHLDAGAKSVAFYCGRRWGFDGKWKPMKMYSSRKKSNHPSGFLIGYCDDLTLGSAPVHIIQHINILYGFVNGYPQKNFSRH